MNFRKAGVYYLHNLTANQKVGWRGNKIGTRGSYLHEHLATITSKSCRGWLTIKAVENTCMRPLIFFCSLLVHLPIGMLTVLAAMELAAFVPRFKKVNASAGFVLMLATPLAIVTVICGWFLSLEGGYAESLLAWHKWLGTGTAAGCIMSAVLFCYRKFKAYRVSLFATVGLLMVTGHLGGSITHGNNYLTRYAPWSLNKILNPTPERKLSVTHHANDFQQLPVFTGVIEPIFESRCVKCHGPDKSKASLRLDSFEAAIRGSENGPVIKSAHADQSPLMKRVLLPFDSDDHMPPDGKPQLSTGEITILKWWINSGALETNTLSDLHPPIEILEVLPPAASSQSKRIQTNGRLTENQLK